MLQPGRERGMIDTTLIEKAKERGNKIIGACPACRADGGDKKGNHFFYNTQTEQFGCAVHQGDPDHRSEIFAHVGIITESAEEEKKEYATRKERKKEREVMRLLEAAQDRRAKANAPAALKKRLRPYLKDDWYLEFLDQSPIRFHDEETLRHEFLLRLFYSDDILWLGKDRYQSGQPHHAANFRTRDEWLKDKDLPPLVAAGVFREGSISRGKDAVELSPYIVIECDEIGDTPAKNKKLSAALIRYAQKALGLILRAVIDTGNKSLHAWFDRPSQTDFEALLKHADHFMIDPGLLEQCQHSPLRLPGAIHEKSNKPATLIYLNPITP